MLKEKTYLERMSCEEDDSGLRLSFSVANFSSCSSTVTGNKWGWVVRICIKSSPTGDSSSTGASGAKFSLESSSPKALTVTTLLPRPLSLLAPSLGIQNE